MKILVLGASGFIGNAIFLALVTEHEITIGGRSNLDGYSKFKYVDFAKENEWNEVLRGTELVINAVGIVNGDFDLIQTKVPLKLFETCANMGIRVIQISAIGAEKASPPTTFLKTKKIADDFVISHSLGKVIYPGIVLGAGARSTQLFAELAALPVVPLISSKPIPFIHISQLCSLVVKIIRDMDSFPKQIFAVAQPETLKEIFTALRGKKPLFWSISPGILKIWFRIFPKFSVDIFNKDMFMLLNTISAAEYAPIGETASVKLRPIKSSKCEDIPYVLGIGAVSFIWLWSGISSLISWQKSVDLMKDIGVSENSAPYFIYAGTTVDILLGILIFYKRIRSKIMLLQIGIILGYTLILSLLAPHHWLHPFGPVSKNIPLLALIFLLNFRYREIKK